MHYSFALVALLLVSAVSCQNETLGFEGTWIDNFGFSWSLCVTNNGASAAGSYSQFGLMRGDLTDDQTTLTGTWYETHFYSDDVCPYGDFSFHVDGNSITGEYACWDGTSGGEWSASRIHPVQDPALSDCVAGARNGDLEGQWALSDLTNFDICINGDQFQASYEVNNNPFYAYGDVFMSGRLLQGSAVEQLRGDNIKTYGTLISLFVDDSLFSFNWVTPITTPDVLAQNPAQYDTYQFVQRKSDSSPRADCARYNYLKLGDDEDDFMYYESESSAPILSGSIVIIAAVLAMLI